MARGRAAPAAIVYHCVDDIAAQKGVRSDAFRVAEARFAARADLVLASAPALAERMRTLNERVALRAQRRGHRALRHALDDGPTDPALAALPHPRIVFTGAVVATKLDLDLLEGVAQARPDWSIALVGPVGAGDPRTDVSRAPARVPNVHLLGSRPYEALPEVLRGADAALVPTRSTTLTRSVFPMKVFEYLAAGLPVGDHAAARAGRPPAEVAAAPDAPATAAALERALSAGWARPRARARSQAVLRPSWDARLEEIASYLSRLPRVSA